MIDIHCHLLPGLDDGPDSWEQTLDMARMAVDDGVRSIVATPHQLGNYRHNSASLVRSQLAQLRQHLQTASIPLTVYAGADVRIEPDLIERLQSGDVVTLADQGRHVLLELPHDVSFSLTPVLHQLSGLGVTGILSHPERNLGILSDPSCLGPLVDQGCLMQVTAGSLLGRFGPPSQRLAEAMLRQGLVHLLASDGHGTQRRRPLLRAAYERVVALTDRATADDLCHNFPAWICQGQAVPMRRRPPVRARRRWFALARRG
jgi:protein-tyrosine phosphatase